VGRVPSTVGIVPTELHRSMTLRQEEDDERRISVVTGPIGAPVIHRMARISIGPRGQPQGPLATDRHNTANLTCPFPRCVGSAAGTSFKRGRPFRLWDRISRVCATIGYSVGSLTTPPHPTKAEHPSLGTQRPGLAGEWAEEEGERRRGTWMSG
jgi:hypothetical protein